MKKRKVYSQRLKDEVCHYVIDQGHTKYAASKKFGIGQPLVGVWVNKYKEEKLITDELSSHLDSDKDQSEKIRLLENENKFLRSSIDLIIERFLYLLEKLGQIRNDNHC